MSANLHYRLISYKQLHAKKMSAVKWLNFLNVFFTAVEIISQQCILVFDLGEFSAPYTYLGLYYAGLYSYSGLYLLVNTLIQVSIMQVYTLIQVYIMLIYTLIQVCIMLVYTLI